MPTYYSIKYALSSDGEIASFEGECVQGQYASESGTKFHRRFETIGKECFETQAEAIAAFKLKRQKKIASLRRQIDKLEKMRPSIGGVCADPDPAGKAAGEP